MNPYGILHNYDNVPLYTPNFNLVNSVLQYKQGNLNENRSKLEDLVSNYANLDILRDVDKEYANSRLKAVLQMSNKYAAMDLSDPGLSSQLTRNVSQFFDDNVQNAVYSTKVFRAEQAEWEKARKDSPEKYSETNHQYALQFAQPWLQSKQVGETYRGGAGFREYTDYQKKIQDNIPKIAELLKAEYIRDENGNGMFRAIGTYEEIDRGRLEQALQGVLNQKDLEQMKIDAWGQYNNAPEEKLREAFNGYMQPRIEAAEKEIGTVRALMQTEKDPERRQQYQDYITSATDRLGSMRNQNYDKVGKEAAYTTMFREQFFDTYLDAYSYAPRKIKEEVNQLDVETFNANIKLRQEQRADERFIFDKNAYAERMELEYAKLQAKGTTNNKAGNIAGTGLTPVEQALYDSQLVLTESILGSGDVPNAKSNIDFGVEMERKATRQMLNAFSGYGLTEADLSDPAFVAAIKGTSGTDKTSFTYKGKSIVVNMTNEGVANAIHNFQNNVINDNPVRKKAYAEADKLINTTISNLAQAYGSGDNEFDAKLPSYTFKLVDDGKGGFKVQKLDPKFTSQYNYMQTLAYKKGKGQTLTNAEEASLKLMTGMWLSAGTNKKSTGDYIFQKSYQDIVSKISSGADVLPSNSYENKMNQWGVKTTAVNILNMAKKGQGTYEGLLNTIESGNSGYEKQLKEYVNLVAGLRSGNYTEAQAASARTKMSNIERNIVGKSNVINNEVYKPGPGGRSFTSLNINEEKKTAYGSGEGYTIRPTTASADEFKNWGSSSFDLAASLKAYENTVETQADRYFDNTNKNPSKSSLVMDSNSATGQKLLTNFGLTPKQVKDSKIVAIPILSGGIPTGAWDIQYKKENEDKELEYTSLGRLTREQSAELGLVPNRTGRPTYDAMYGEGAPTINMGTTNFAPEDISRKARIMTKYGDAPFKKQQATLEYAEQAGVGTEVAQLFELARKNAFQFKVEARDGQYYNSIYLNGKIWGAEPLNKQTLTEQDVHEMTTSSQYFNQRAFMSALSEKIDEMAGAKLVNQKASGY